MLLAAMAYTILLKAIVAEQGPGSRLATAVGSDVKGKISTALYALAIPLAFVHEGIAQGIFVFVALMWLVPDRRIERVLDWAKVRGYREGENPARWRGHLDKVFPKKSKIRRVEHHPAVARMRPGSVLVDIAIDQGGCFEDSRPTTHAEPTFRVHNSVFYCVANMPGAVPHTSTYALTNVTLPYAMAIANAGIAGALAADAALASGLNAIGGTLTNEPVAEAHGLECAPIPTVLPSVTGIGG
jgi:hypothetical protein